MSNAKIFLVDPVGKRLMPMLSTKYLNEDQLQRYLADYSDLIPGDQIDPESPRRWLLVAREIGVPGTEGETGRWSLDHLFLDQDGTPTFVECKRATDTRTRREVVAQMLDYAANGLTYWTMDRLRQAAAETAQRRQTDLDTLLLALLDSEEPADVEGFWRNVEAKLRSGQVRLIFVVDEAPRELRRLVEFLNEKMNDVEVLIVEVKQYQGEGHTALAPRVLGITESARAQKTEGAGRKPDLTPGDFLTGCTPAQQRITQAIWNAADEHGYVIRWRPTAYAVRAVHPVTGVKMSFLYGYRDGNVDVYFEYIPWSSGVAATLRKELAATGLYRSSGKQTMAGRVIDEHNLASVLDVLERVYMTVDETLKHLASSTSQEPM